MLFLSLVSIASIVAPIELYRTRAQAGSVHVRDTLLMEVRHSGIKVLFRGLLPTLYRDVPFSGIYWSCYETLKARFSEQTFMALFVSGSVAGSIACVLTHPFDVVKTMQQVSDERTGVRSLLKTSGWRVLYTGLVPRLAKIAPACGIMISSYELGKVFYADIGK